MVHSVQGLARRCSLKANPVFLAGRDISSGCQNRPGRQPVVSHLVDEKTKTE